MKLGGENSPALALQKDGNVGGRQGCTKPSGPGVEPSEQFPKVRIKTIKSNVN